MKQKRLWLSFPVLATRVKNIYKTMGIRGGPHDWYHALAVAQYAAFIAPNAELEELGWVTGLLHDVPHRLFPGEEGTLLVRSHLDCSTVLAGTEKERVLDAILRHSGRDTPTDDPLLMILRDADRLANIGAWHFLRAGQFRPAIPAVDPRFITEQDPMATFKDPKSVLRDIEHTLEWENWLRLPRAKKLGKPLFDDIRLLKTSIERQFETLGLLPFPPELVAETV